MNASPDDRLIVSAVNGGGVFLVDGDRIEALSRVDTTGVTAVPGGFLMARQAEGRAEVRRLVDRVSHRICITEQSLDLHDLLWSDGRLYVVCTHINTVLELDADTFAELRSWYFDGEPDCQHVNSLCLHEGRILVSRFGRFTTYRGYKGRTRGAGEVVDLETGEVLIAGLSQPHSLTSFDGMLWLCDSEAHAVRVYRDMVLEATHVLDGYVRGLAFGEDNMYVGLSRSRNEAVSPVDSARILTFDRASMQQIAQVDLPVNEVYDLRLAGDTDIDGLRASALFDANAEFDTLRHQRNLAERAMHEAEARALAVQAEFDSIAHERNIALNDANGAHLVAEHARQTLTADRQRLAARDQASELVVAEESIWSELLVADGKKMRAVIAAHGDVVASALPALESMFIEAVQLRADNCAQLATISEMASRVEHQQNELEALSAGLRSHRDFVDRVVSSRSWRWTRWLRRSGPTVPVDIPRSAQAIAEARDLAGGDCGIAGGPLTRHPPEALDDKDDGIVLPGATHVVPVVPASDERNAARDAIEQLRAGVDRGVASAHELATPVRGMVPVLGLQFADHAAPSVSIVVTAYGQFARTLDCLRSIRDAGDATTFEVILIEDASGDAEMARLASIPGLRYQANPENLGFLRSANQAVGLARGEFVHLLNNDTRVCPGWLDKLMQTFMIFHECGMAGSKLVYPDGRLQEAGGIVWSDGDAMNHGRGDDPGLPRYATVREVDYVSGASVLIRAALFRDLGGFDERYLPAYYEDTDLAFRVRAARLKVYVQPDSVVVHDEGLSHGTDVGSGIKSSQVRNRAVFLERWRDTLESTQLPPGEHLFLASDRGQLQKTVLIVDRHPPHTDRDAGSRAIWQLMRVLHLFGFNVKFWSDLAETEAAYVDLLRVHGFELFDDASTGLSFDCWMATHGRYFDYVLLSRPLVASEHIDAVRRSSAAKIVYYGHDVHHLRIERQFALTREHGMDAHGRHLKRVEEALWREADLTLYPSGEEELHVGSWLGNSGLDAGRVASIPLFAYEVVTALDDSPDDGPEHRRDLLFVGGFAHAPNADGAVWFAREVWPMVRQRHPGFRLCLVGAAPTDELLGFAADDVVVTGQVTEQALIQHYRTARIAIAPLRFGAGTKGKVLEAMRFGVPCVTTTTGAQGLPDATFLRVADDPERMAAEIAELIADNGAWWQASRHAQAFVRERFSVHSVWKVLSTVMDAAPYPDVEARRQQITRSPISPRSAFGDAATPDG